MAHAQEEEECTYVSPCVEVIDCSGELGGVVGYAFVCGIDVVVEFRVQEADDLAALIVTNGLVLCIPEHRDRVPAFVRPVRREVEVT